MHAFALELARFLVDILAAGPESRVPRASARSGAGPTPSDSDGAARLAARSAEDVRPPCLHSVRDLRFDRAVFHCRMCGETHEYA